jgi:multidrug resistance efflux pump
LVGSLDDLSRSISDLADSIASVRAGLSQIQGRAGRSLINREGVAAAHLVEVKACPKIDRARWEVQAARAVAERARAQLAATQEEAERVLRALQAEVQCRNRIQ